jgi:hypothetical protein
VAVALPSEESARETASGTEARPSGSQLSSQEREAMLRRILPNYQPVTASLPSEEAARETASGTVARPSGSQLSPQEREAMLRRILPNYQPVAVEGEQRNQDEESRRRDLQLVFSGPEQADSAAQTAQGVRNTLNRFSQARDKAAAAKPQETQHEREVNLRRPSQQSDIARGGDMYLTMPLQSALAPVAPGVRQTQGRFSQANEEDRDIVDRQREREVNLWRPSQQSDRKATWDLEIDVTKPRQSTTVPTTQGVRHAHLRFSLANEEERDVVDRQRERERELGLRRFSRQSDTVPAVEAGTVTSTAESPLEKRFQQQQQQARLGFNEVQRAASSWLSERNDFMHRSRDGFTERERALRAPAPEQFVEQTRSQQQTEHTLTNVTNAVSNETWEPRAIAQLPPLKVPASKGFSVIRNLAYLRRNSQQHPKPPLQMPVTETVTPRSYSKPLAAEPRAPLEEAADVEDEGRSIRGRKSAAAKETRTKEVKGESVCVCVCVLVCNCTCVGFTACLSVSF